MSGILYKSINIVTILHHHSLSTKDALNCNQTIALNDTCGHYKFFSFVIALLMLQ